MKVSMQKKRTIADGTQNGGRWILQNGKQEI